MNLDPWIPWLLLAAYASFAAEWAVLSVRSEVSARRLLGAGPAVGDPLAAVRRQPWSRRLVRYGLPTALGLLVGLLPLAAQGVVLPGQLGSTTGLAAAGLTIAFASRLWSILAAIELRRTAGGIARGGPFCWSRHPILLGMHAFCLGVGLVQPNMIHLLGLAAWIALMHRRVRLEEAALLLRHGADYRDYMARVACYLGWRQEAA